MRLAFIATAAAHPYPIHRRRPNHPRYHRRKTSVSGFENFLDSILTLNWDLVHCSKDTAIPSRVRRRRRNSDHPYAVSPSRSTFRSQQTSSHGLSSDTTTIQASTCIHRGKSWPFLAFWHLISLILFLFSTSLTSAASSSSAPSNMEEERKFWTPSTQFDVYTDENVRRVDSDGDSSIDWTFGDGGSCTLLDYFLSPSPYSPSSSIVRRSVDRSPSPFSAPSNPDMENVFAIWLRASQYGRTVDEDEDEDTDTESNWPVQRPRARHRYQRYRNTQGNRISTKKTASSSTSTKKASSSGTTRRPLKSNSTSRIFRPTQMSQSSSKAKANRKKLKKPSSVRVQSKQSAKEFPQCKLFDERSAEELCVLEVHKRVEALRYVYVKTNMGIRGTTTNDNQSNSSDSNVTLYQLFALGVSTDAQKSRPRVNHLDNSLRPCIISTPVHRGNGTKKAKKLDPCRTCYRTLLDRLSDIDSRHEAFTQSVLAMIDCEPDNDLEQFSPTSNCSECKLWYKRWLLVIFSGIWRQKPCVQWCHLAELACPHMPPVRKHDYAGLPSFRCIDPEVGPHGPGKSTYGPACDCIHPCDKSSQTIQWGWDLSSELTDFCGDYRKRERTQCAASTRKKTSSTTTSPSTKTKPRRNRAIGLQISNRLVWSIMAILVALGNVA